MQQSKVFGGILITSTLIVAQYILAFFVYKLPGLPALQWTGWGIWALSAIFGIAPIFILGCRGGVAKGKSYVETADREGIEKFGDEYLRYMQRVPQVNFILGGMRLVQWRKNGKAPQA